jgi:hypothetical protein
VPHRSRSSLVVVALGSLLVAAACSSSPSTATVDGGAGQATQQPLLTAGTPGSPGASTSATPSGSPSAHRSSAPSARPGSATASGCSILPANNVWRADVSHLPVSSRSAAYIASIGSSATVHADFGSGTWNGAPIGIPITTVSANQAKTTVTFQYAGESDAGPYPIPTNPAIEGGPNSTGDRHVILYDPAHCRDYELYAAYPKGGGWSAGSGAVYNLTSNALRPAGWTSADAAGLPILPGLVTWADMKSGHINHAIRVTAPATQAAYVWPARHQASSDHSLASPPMGLRLRLKASVDISRLPAQARIVATAMKKYGVIVADNGSPWFISGAPDSHFDNDALHALGSLTGSDFEAVDESSLMASTNSGAVR